MPKFALPTRITLDVLPHGMVRITSNCVGRPDASYPPMSDSHVAPEVRQLLGELRERSAGVRRPDVLTPHEALTNLTVEFGNLLHSLAEPIHRATADGSGPLESVTISEENRTNFMAAGLIEAIGDAQAAMRALRRQVPKAGGKS